MQNIQLAHSIDIPCSPDLTHYNFDFFSKLKSSPKGKRFQNMDEIMENEVAILKIGRKFVISV